MSVTSKLEVGHARFVLALGSNFVAIQFAYKIYPFQVYKSMVSGLFTEPSDPHRNHVWNIS